MEGVEQTRGAFNGVRTKVGGWPDMQGASMVIANAKKQSDYQPPVKGTSITTRTEASDAALSSARKAKLAKVRRAQPTRVAYNRITLLHNCFCREHKCSIIYLARDAFLG